LDDKIAKSQPIYRKFARNNAN